MVGNGEPFICGYCSNELDDWDVVLEHGCFQGNDNLVLQNKNTVYSQAGNVDNPLFGMENCEWSKDAVLLLIEKYKENREFLEKKNTVKRHIWRKLSQEMHTAGYNYSWDQIQNKWKGLVRTYRNIKMFNYNTGRNRKKWEFFDVLENTLKDSLTIETSIIVLHNGEQSQDQPSTSTTPPPTSSTTSTITEINDTKFDLDIHNYAVDISSNSRKRKRNNHDDDDDNNNNNDDSYEIVDLFKMAIEQNKKQHEDDLREKRRFNALLEKLVNAITKK